MENYARGQHLTNIRHYIDDDESGRFFDRSAYSRMMDDVENGKIGVCIMKDLTRWGRDYLQVGNAIEYVLDRMRENTTYVRNIKKYLLAALYNAPATIGSYYTSLVSHDMYGGGDRR